MDISVGDILVMKKNHPCGSNRFLVLRVGMDFKLRCQGCGREMMLTPPEGRKSYPQSREKAGGITERLLERKL